MTSLMLRPVPRRGVTLVELVVALAVLATAAMLVPAVRSPALRDDATTSVAAVVSRARREAVRRGTSVRLTFDASGAWRAVTLRGDTTLSGHLDGAGVPARTMALVIDMLGGCQHDTSVPDAAMRSAPLDAHRCADDAR